MAKYFGTDGFRGCAGVALTSDHAYRIGRFLGWYYNREHKARVVIGKDTRLSSYMFEYALIAGLTASGADAYMLHVTTTPSVSYISRVDEFDCGIMISASHNPYNDNGIKLINSNGEKMEDEVIDKIEEYLDSDRQLPMASGENIGRTVDYASGRNRYIGYLISLGMYSFKGLRIGLDCANGSSWNIAKAVFEALGAKTCVINAEPDGTNINRDAGSTHIEGLQRLVRDNHLDCGFAFDGDADRCLCVDENGDVLTGDHILYACGTYMQSRGMLPDNTIVTTVMSNFGLYKALDAKGIQYAKTQVGDKYVYQYMRDHGSRIGGEQSGHIIFNRYATTGDGILTALKMMECMLARKCRMSQVCEGLTFYPQTLKNIRVKSKPAANADADVQRKIDEIADRLGTSGRILVRESGTEPVIRVMVEAETKKMCDDYVDEVIWVIRRKGHEDQ